MLETPKIIKDTASRIGESLSPTRLQHTAKQSSLTIKLCGMCKKRPADSLAGLLCSVCYRKIEFEKLPVDQQRRQILSVVPERYIDATINQLPVKLRSKVSGEATEGIFMWGATGTGKTYTMAALASKFITAGFICQRLHYEMLCLKLRDTFNPKAVQTELQIIEPFLECDMLFIEDVGTTKSMGHLESDFSLRVFYILLDIRLEHMRPTYITSNKSLENLTKSFDERIGDRLKTFVIINLGTKSRREVSRLK